MLAGKAGKSGYLTARECLAAELVLIGTPVKPRTMVWKCTFFIARPLGHIGNRAYLPCTLARNLQSNQRYEQCFLDELFAWIYRLKMQPLLAGNLAALSLLWCQSPWLQRETLPLRRCCPSLRDPTRCRGRVLGVTTLTEKPAAITGEALERP